MADSRTDEAAMSVQLVGLSSRLRRITALRERDERSGSRSYEMAATKAAT
jgi:hypothetical protein